jgi:hypothetical protein
MRNYDAKRWLKLAESFLGVTHVIVVQDPSGNPYPRLVRHYEDVQEVAKMYGYPKPFHQQEVLEVFNLSLPKKDQLNQERCIQW